MFALSLAYVCPAAATAAPIVHNFDVTPDGTLQTFEGAFTFDNDIALFSFVLGEGTFDFTAFTTSYATGGFDPVLSLYTVPAGEPARLYRDVDESIPTSVDDIDFPNDLDSALPPLTLHAGTYILALTQSLNFIHEDFTFDWNADEFQCGAGVLVPICEQQADSPLRQFAVSVAIRDTTPVPEPGTLSLMALGSLATAALRRRRKAAVTTRQ